MDVCVCEREREVIYKAITYLRIKIITKNKKTGVFQDVLFKGDSAVSYVSFHCFIYSEI